MKNKYFHLLGLVVLAVFGLSQSVFGQVTSYPYLENFDSQSTCGTSCTSVCTLTAGGWTNSTTDDKDWAVDASGTSSSSTGPSGDHTTGTGNYIYTEASSCYGKVADLISPVFDFTSLTNPSLEFYYHMYGQSMGSLEVFVSTDGGTSWTNALFSLSGEQQTSNSDPYLQAEVPLCAYAGQSSVTIRITGTTGTNFYSDMAIDDIQVYEATTCFAPTSLSTANEVGTSADLNWTNVCAVSYDYVVVPMGSPQTATAVASGNVATNMATASGLSATTNYDVYVRSNCSGSSSAWAGPFTIFSGCTGALTGSYTVGGSSPDYATISEAITSLSNCGVSAPVTINIAAGTYNEQLVIPAISGASATNTVTIQGAGSTSTIISYDGTGSSGTAVEFNGAKHVSLKNVGIENTSSSTPAFGIHLWNAADTITIENCDIKVPTNTTSSLVVGILSSGSQTSTGTAGDNANGLLVKDCNVTGGYYGIRLYGSSTTASDNLNNRIQNTVVDSVYFYGIYLYYQGLPEVRGCTVSNTRNSSSYGIYAVYTPGIEVHKNWLQNLGTYGIYLSNVNTTTQPLARRCNVTNNMVSATGSGDALYLSAADSINIYYNTLYADADQALWINSTSDDYDVRNNILVSANETPVDLDAAPDATDIMDYNVMYSENGSDIMDVSTSSYADLATLQAAALGTNFNTNSVEGDPSFVGSPDLHVLASTANDVAVVIAGITDDFDGDARSGSTPDIGADEFTPASCLPPTAMAAANMTDLTAELSWTPGGTETTWNIEYGPTGYTQGAGTTVSAVTANPYTLTGLSPNTTYDFYIQSDCGTGTSIYVFGATFTTACSAFSTPFSESFDVTSMPSCWSAYGSDPWLFTTTWPAYGAGSASDHTGNSGSFAGIDGSGGSSTNDGTLESPLIDLTGLTTAQLSFYVFSNNTDFPGDNATLNVEVWDGSVWTNELSYAGDNASWVEQTVDLSSYSGTIKIRFIVDQTTMTNSAFYNDIMIDDISVADAPSCSSPSSLGLDSVDHAMAIVYWTTGGASDWIIEYGTAGFTLGSGTQMVASNDTATISGLMASTAYEFYVADSCGLGDVSAFTGPFAFNTTANCPGTESLPYAENFNTGSGCFSTIDGGGSSGDTWAHTVNGSQNLDGTGYMRVDSDANGNGTHMIETLESPVIDASSVSNSLVLEFDHYYRALGDSATVQVYDGANWVNVAVYKNSTGGWTSPSHETLDVTAYANANFQVRFMYDDNNSWAWYWNVDNFSVEDKCLTQSLPYVENFNSGAGCFSTVDGGDASGDTWAPASSGSQDLDGTDYMRVDSDANGNGTYMREELVSPKIDASGFAGTLLLEYDHYYRSVGSDTGFVDVWDGTAWVNVATYTSSTGAWSAPAHESIDISAYANADLQVRFDYDDGNSWAWYWSVDNFSIMDVGCLAPSALGLDTVDHSMATVFWTTGGASDWIVEYGPAGFSLGSGTQVIATNDTITITGLSSSTAYEFYVADSCGLADISAFTGPFAFNTTSSCPATEALPFAENFDVGIGCFTAIDGGGSSGDTWAHTVSGSQNLDGTGYMRVDSDANGNGTHMIETLESPVIDASSVSKSLILEFDHYYRALGDSATVQVYDGTNWVNVAIYKNSTGGWSNPSHEIIDVTAYANANFQVRFFYDDGNSWTWYWSVDNFSVEDKCLTQSLPFVENFDADQGCFSSVDGGAASGDTWAHTTNGSQNLDGTGYMRVDSDANGNGTYMREQLVSPIIDASGFAGTLLLEYDHYFRSISGDTGFVDVWDGTAWVNVAMYTATTGGWSSPAHEAIDISAYANADLQVRFDYDDGNTWAWYWSVDNFSIMDVGCLPPSALGYFNVGTSSAEIFWTTGGASNWQVEYGPAGFSLGSGTRVSATNDTILLSNLQGATTYDFYVQDSCGATDLSTWAGPVSFATACPASVMAPYSTDFEGISTGNYTTFDNCWTTFGTTNPAWYADVNGTGSSGTGPNFDHTTGGGGVYMFLETSSPSSLGDTNVLYSPAIDISPLTNPQVSFWYHMYGATMGNLRIWAEDTGGNRTVLDSIIGQQQTTGSDPWLQMQIPLSGLASGTYRFLFEGIGGSSFTSDMAIDDFAVEEAPNCFASSNLVFISSDNTSATVTWTAGTGTSWDVEYGPAGFSPGSGTIINSTNDTLTITGLSASTAYDFYVTDSCGASGLSTTVGPQSFVTSACPLSDQCMYTFDLYDTFGDGWNGGGIKIYQNGLQVAALGGNFTAGTSSLGNMVPLCDNLPIVVTLDPAGAWPSEMEIVAIQPNGDTAGVHSASATVGTGDTLFSFTSNCSSCITYQAPFFESFEVNSPSITCWTNVFVADTFSWSLGTGSSGGSVTTAYAGATNAVFVSANGGPDTTLLVSPVINLNALVSPQLSFWYAQESWAGDQNVTNVYYRASANDPWTFLFGDNADRSAWTFATMSLPNPSSTYQIAIEGVNNWGRANVVDSLSITDAAVICSQPDSVMASNITFANADVSWVSSSNASSSFIEYGPLGFVPGTGAIVNPASNPTTLMGLMPGTTYEACVYDICSSLGDTSMAACVTFTTPCAPISNYPYMEDFDNGVFPACYSETTTSSGSYVWAPDAGGTSSTNTGPAVDHTLGTAAGYYMYVEASSPAAQGDSAFLYTPEFDLTSLTNPEIVYYYHMYGADIVNLDLQAYDRTSMTWVSLNNIVGQQQTANGDAWLEARINIAAYTSDTAQQFRFLSVRGASFDGDAALDDIIVRETPACVDPANLMVVTAASNSVTLAWDSDTNIVASTVQYGAPGFMLGSGTNVAATPGGFTLTGLSGTTCYDFYVKDSCSTGTNWVGPVSACTIATCSVSSMPSGTTNDTTDCDGGPTTLMATSSSNNDLVWLTNGMVRETGATYVTDSVAFTTAFDVAEYVTTNPVLHVGPLTNIAASGFGNFSNGQWITVDDTIHIDSMTVLHQNDVVAFAQIWDASITNVIQRGDTFSTPAGVTGDMRVPVNMVLTPGVYFMNVDFLSGAGSLFRATDGAAYPYDLPGLMSIDSTNFSAQIRIYYTFDLTVSKACIGSATQALAVVPGANAGISDTSLVCSSDNAANLAAFLGVHDNGGTWVDNDATGALTDSILDATQLTAGNTYHFSYILAGVNGCAGDTADVWAEVEAAPFGGVDTSLALCSGSGITILRNYLTGTAFGGTWVDLDGSGALNTGTGVFNSNNAAVGTYRILYVLAGVACPADTTMLTVSVDAVVSAGMDISDTACDDETMVDLSTYLDPAATAGGTWTDLSGSGALSGNIFDATAVANMTSYNFQYKVNSACGDDSAVVTLYVDDCDVSVREMHTGLINIYPNPTTGLIKIDDQNVRGTIKVEVYAGNGQLMIFEEYAENEEIRLDISNFATGIYTVKVNSAAGIDVKRIMKH
ncbi:T9SS-dependent choice-of-anchor J family protein [Croceimicrobium hydrocarbonivorans]|uniref:Choice-of-anchor J domain-containing protein n=1 Tax=Croceimicrobium hydrocarbonivorans TaxID=2761580 RepID=A0A7H0VJ79_9FLAO|nr:choice-of-anchor J domain-containing protein [Croceimicrobium hydrocarbonivorans]QNR25777.1 choice-of-anchor J domain-containing protein [Croceimicrobium hydrocarbonivorans]